MDDNIRESFDFKKTEDGVYDIDEEFDRLEFEMLLNRSTPTSSIDLPLYKVQEMEFEASEREESFR